MKKRTLVLVVSILLVALVAAGGTLAWLMDKDGAVVNTFSPSTIDITLTETASSIDDKDNNVNTNDYKMVPGADNAKDPKVTVKAGSEACWVYVKVEAVNNTVGEKAFLEYTVRNDWNVLDATNYPGVYYKKVAASDEDQAIYVLTGKDGFANGFVKTNSAITKEDMATLDNELKYPKLNFTAYAIQQEGFASAVDAWPTAAAQQ